MQNSRSSTFLSRKSRCRAKIRLSKIEDLRPDLYMSTLFRDFVGIQIIFCGIIRIKDCWKKFNFPTKNALKMRMRQMKFFIDWTISFEINNYMDIISLHKMMYTRFEQKKTPSRGTKSSIRIYSHCNWIDRFDFKLYIFISKHFFWSPTCHDTFSWWEYLKSFF